MGLAGSGGAVPLPRSLAQLARSMIAKLHSHFTVALRRRPQRDAGEASFSTRPS
jgi:hypothetical protein